MSFFSKLRDRLTRSSSKIGAGLDDIVADGAGSDAAVPEAPAPTPAPTVAPAPAEPAARPGMLGRMFGRTAEAEPRRELDDAMLEELEEMLIQSDMGVETALRVTANIAEGRIGRRISATELKELLAGEIGRIMTPVAKPLPLYPKRPQVVLVVGVNGSGKTTSIGKLAKRFQAEGKSVLLAAGDTFRAAAREQLQEWGRRNDVTVISQDGGDPAAVVFDAINAARARGIDIVLADTAGRLPTQLHLMEEIAKVRRVIQKADPSGPHEVLLVLDSNIGQNALAQLAAFDKAVGVTGLVVTKLDGTAKGGVLAAIARTNPKPIRFIGVGERIDDMQPFVAREFVEALFDAAPNA